MAAIELEHLSKVYGSDVRAVDDIDLEIEHGEFVTLVGPSGCGKTTTLRLIAGFEEPTDGRVLIDGEDVTTVPPYRRDVGMVFQSFALFPHMTVAKNISYGMRVSDRSFTQREIDDRVAEMLDMIELPGVEDRMPDQLSGGQQQRVALARALALNPAALLLDEPLASLDENLRKQMQAEVTRIQKELDVTTVFVTHNQEEAMTMSDRIVVMNEGRFEQKGRPSDLYHHPDSLFVAEFLGKANTFRGTVTGRSGTHLEVETSIGTLRATAEEMSSIEDGATVGVVVRPEAITLSQDAQPSADETTNVVEGTVNLAQMLGNVVEYRIYTPDGTEIIASQPSAENESRRGFQRGEEITVRFDADACSVLERETAIDDRPVEHRSPEV